MLNSTLRKSLLTPTVVFLLFVFSGCIETYAQTWRPQAPGPNTKGQVEEIEDGEVAGAIKTIAAHPTDPNIVYVGAVNGGIWKTNNGMSASPSWVQLADNQKSLSIGALEFDPKDLTHNTLVAGTGRFSSFGGDGGILAGLLRTTNGGSTWTSIDGGGVLKNLNISGVAPRGAIIVVSVNGAENLANTGIWRTTDTGATWKQISGRAGTGLPRGPTSDLAGDPSNANRLFTNGGPSGLYRSDDAGATWTKVSNPEMDLMINGADNIKLDVGNANNVYVAVVRFGSLAAVFRSTNGATSWSQMDLPGNAEGGIHPGRQGGIHLSIAADRSNPNIVYIGGDRQDDGASRFPAPNSIGAKDYSGRLFRGDASKPANSQWVHLTHSKTLGAPGGGTAKGSAPHADSRDMAMAANGVLLEVDDGGIYRRTNPQDNTGDWFSMNGDLQATEFHSVAWDSVSNIVIGGAQDTGTPAQRQTTNLKWASVSTGDGGVVAVDDISAADRSTRYSSFYDLFDFRRQVFDASNALLSEDRPALRVLNGAPVAPLFYSPIRLNTIVATRLIIGGENGLYESDDQGDTLKLLARITVNQTGSNIIAYGAKQNPDALYVGSDRQVFVRTIAGKPLTASGYSGERVMSIAIDPNNAKIAYVIDSNDVFRTTNSGTSWTKITGNLAALSPGDLRSIAYSTNTTAGELLIGGSNGAFSAPGPSFSQWSRLGVGLPTVPIAHIEYDPVDRIILVGTLGRGAWTLSSSAPPPPAVSALSHSWPQSTLVVPPAQTPPPPGQARVLPTTIPPRQPSTVNSGRIPLRPGVVVDPSSGRVFVMGTDGQTRALNIGDGKEIWRTPAAAKPLGLVGTRLLGQAESTVGEKGLRIVVLDPATGKIMATASRELPEKLSSQVGQTMRDELKVQIEGSNDDPIVTWQFSPRHKKGIRPDTPDTLPGLPNSTTSDEQFSNGAFRVDLNTGATTAASQISSNVASAASVTTTAPVPGLPEKQLLSADRRHLMVSERVGGGDVWLRYLLSIYDLTTGKLLGQFKSHLSTVPFVVSKSTVVFETGPYVQRTGAELINEPAKIRGIDLTTGTEIWNTTVRDTTDSGPFPP